MEEFDEDIAIKYIREHVSDEVRSAKYDDDEILNVIDIIWDYYEDNGFLDIADDDSDDNVNTDKLIEHVKSIIKKDKYTSIKLEHISELVNAELAYEQSIES